MTTGIQQRSELKDLAYPDFSSWYSPSIQVESFKIHRLWDALLRWKLPVLAFVMVLTSFAWISSGLLTPRYEATASLRLDGRNLEIPQPRSSDAYDRIDPVALETQIKAITASEVLAVAARQVGLKYYAEFNKSLFPENSDPVDLSEEERDAILLRALGEAVAVNQVGASGVATLSVRSRDPVLAAHTANAIADNFIKHQTSQARARIMEAIDALVAQQSELERQLGEREREIVRLQEEHGLVFSDEPRVASALFGNVREMLIQSEADLAQDEQRYDTLSQKSRRAEAIKEISFSPLIQELRTERARLTIEMTAISADISSLHPRMISAKNRLTEIDAIIDQEVDRLAAALRTETAALSRRVEMLRSKLEGLEVESRIKAESRIRLTALVEESEALRRSIETLKTQIESIGAGLGLQQSNVDFVSRAIPPADPVFPRRKIIVAGALAGATGLAGLFLLALTLFDRRITSFSQIGLIQSLTGCIVVGALPLQKRTNLALTAAQSSYMRSLKPIVGSLGLQHGLFTSIAVYPLSPGDGASTFVRALGLLCSRLEFRTLLFDLSMDGQLAREFIASRENFSVAGKISIEQGVGFAVRDTCEPRLHVLHSPFHGCSQNFRDVADAIKQVANDYDLVIVDCPPLTDDANVLRVAEAMDRALIVTTAEMTRIDHLRFSLGMSLSALGLRPQIVLNRVDRADFII